MEGRMERTNERRNERERTPGRKNTKMQELEHIERNEVMKVGRKEGRKEGREGGRREEMND